MTNKLTTPLSKFPLSSSLYQNVVSKQKKGHFRTDIVSEKLCDDALQCLSPFLRNSSPIDIVDFWPGAGLWSSKVNDFLQPRRHLLVESPAYMKYYGKYVETLRKSKPCYETLPIEPSLDHDWPALFRKYLPEQVPSSRNGIPNGTTKNDTLLILAGPFFSGSKKDHYTPARWWTRFMRSCAQLTDVHSYGCVRLLALLPANEADLLLPRAVVPRKGPAVMTEAVSSRTFEVASSHVVGNWVAWNQWDMLVNSAARASERTAENGVVIPSGRERPPFIPVPKSPDSTKRPIPYVPQAMYGRFHEIQEAINARKRRTSPEKNRATELARARAVVTLNSENARLHEATELTKLRVEIDELTVSLSREAADPKADPDKLKALDEEIASKTSFIYKILPDYHYRVTTRVQQFVDTRRLALHSGSFDDSGFLRDHRPFEPLYIDDEELFPRGTPSSILYFEAGPDSPLMRQLQKFDPSERNDLVNYAETILSALIKIGDRTLAEILQILFRDQPANDVVKLIPSLARFASKKLKPDFEKFPKTVHPNSDDLATGREPDPAASFQENIDYDFSDSRMRSIPVSTMLDIIFEYRKLPSSLPIVELTRHLGGTVTSAMAVGGLASKPFKFK